MTRKENKQCHSCGVDSNGKFHCKKCGEVHNERNQDRRKSRKAVGLCTECGLQAECGMRMCESCQTKNRIKLRNRKSIEKVAKHLGDSISLRAIAKTHPPQTRESKLYHRMHQPRV